MTNNIDLIVTLGATNIQIISTTV